VAAFAGFIRFVHHRHRILIVTQPRRGRAAGGGAFCFSRYLWSAVVCAAYGVSVMLAAVKGWCFGNVGFSV
jgi:hypothetical protein